MMKPFQRNKRTTGHFLQKFNHIEPRLYRGVSRTESEFTKLSGDCGYLLKPSIKSPEMIFHIGSNIQRTSKRSNSSPGMRRLVFDGIFTIRYRIKKFLNLPQTIGCHLRCIRNHTSSDLFSLDLSEQTVPLESR